jgi:peptide/nickel transport system permease protein
MNNLVLARESKVGKLGSRLWVFCREQPLGAIGIVLLLILLVLSVCAPLLTSIDPVRTDTANAMQPPSRQFWFGTDNMGRDMFSRWVYGARMSLIVAACSVGLASFLGGVLGVFSGLVSGRFDAIVQRIMDVMIAMPSIVIAIIIMAMLGTSVPNLIIAIAIPYSARINRITRVVAVSLKESLFVESARVAGASKIRIALQDIAPNCFAPWVVYASALLAIAFLAEASLSFLGLGIPRPAPSWGRDLAENIDRFQFAPWLGIFPGIGICMAIFGANFFGDAMRNIIDPRLKKI